MHRYLQDQDHLGLKFLSEDELLLLKRKFLKSDFKSEQAAQVLGKSVRKVQQLLAAAVLDNTLVRTGVARSIRYRFTE